MNGALQLTPLEIATQMPLGGSLVELPSAPQGVAPAEVLEKMLREHLERGPCAVAFSGGRDSSLVLAAAVRIARAAGLPDPIAITMRWEGDEESNEDEWQETVVRALALDDWHIVRGDAELELLGPLAGEQLRRFGLTWPPDAFTWARLLREVPGGTLLTGVDGDTVFGSWPWARVAAVAFGRERPRLSDARRIALRASPIPVRRNVLRRRHALSLSWLTPLAQEELDARLSQEMASEPAMWHKRMAWLAGRRYVELIRRTNDLVGQWAGGRIAAPLLDDEFLSALGAHGGRAGYGTRTRAMHALFAGYLPEKVLDRRTKAGQSVAWGRGAAEFARTWDGSGVDETLVDPEALREEWMKPVPDYFTLLSLHAAWLADAEMAMAR